MASEEKFMIQVLFRNYTKLTMLAIKTYLGKSKIISAKIVTSGED